MTGPNSWRRGAVLCLAAATVAACSAPAPLSDRDDRLQVITTTGLLRDLVQNVGGERVNVVAMVPDRADPHSYEPSLRTARDAVYADVAFTNYLLLEQHSIIKTLDANLRDEATSVSLAEDAVKYAAEIIPLVEKVSLDTIWLGLRARGDGSPHGATRSSDVLLSVTGVRGPGDVAGYLTGSFGEIEVYFDSRDGFDATNGYRDDTATLPTDAHTHMSWAFSEPGVYEVEFAAALQVDHASKPIEMGRESVTFAVGVKPSLAGGPEAHVLNQGHADVTVDLDTGRVVVLHDAEGGGAHAQTEYATDDVVIEVPNKALSEIPADRQFRFLGRAGDRIHQLPQAVLGKHVHGEIDPHLWQDVGNAMAYVESIRDTLTAADPAGAADYRRNADRYLGELTALDRHVQRTVDGIDPDQRYLITTHDAFAYFAKAYGMTVAGFVTPHPATEPSMADRRNLAETIENLDVPAVFLEPNLAARSSMLVEVAKQRGIDVCPIYGDTFDDSVTTYVELMEFNARSLLRCLQRDEPKRETA